MFGSLKERLFGNAGGQMPERVAARIRETQEESEVVIGWVQLVGVVFFGIV